MGIRRGQERGNKKYSKALVRQGQEVGEFSHTQRSRHGEALIAKDVSAIQEDFDLSTFHPTMKQKFILDNIHRVPIVVVDGVAGCGKTTVAIRAGLDLLKAGKIRQIVFVKTPSEAGDDKLGFLKGGEEEKLEAHFSAMRSVFYQFMSPEKLTAEESAGRIVFAVPNFLQGKTLSRSLVIADEVQNLSPMTVKLVAERSGQGTSIVLLGDSTQQYAHDHREDGFKDFISRVTVVEGGICRPKRDGFVAYHKLTRKDVKRSELAEYISDVYQDWIEDIEVGDVWSTHLQDLGYEQI
jgi:phosphate starvation-inducible protein PhoH and related proteins